MKRIAVIGQLEAFRSFARELEINQRNVVISKVRCEVIVDEKFRYTFIRELDQARGGEWDDLRIVGPAQELDTQLLHEMQFMVSRRKSLEGAPHVVLEQAQAK